MQGHDVILRLCTAVHRGNLRAVVHRPRYSKHSVFAIANKSRTRHGVEETCGMEEICGAVVHAHQLVVYTPSRVIGSLPKGGLWV